MTRIQGRTAFITGGANGIGLGIARALARAGARLALADRDTEALARAREELAAITEVDVHAFDVRDREAFSAAADAAERTLGPVSLLFNNAGVIVTEAPAKLSYALWDFAIGINLHGVINGIQTFLPRMIERGEGGHIVNTSSGSGLVAGFSGTLYSTAKFAVVGMSESLRTELRSSGIGVSVLCPGPVATQIVHRSMEEAPKGAAELSPEQEHRRWTLREKISQSLQQSTDPDTVGEMVLKAIRDNSLYIHTDRSMEAAIKERTEALLDAMPD
jgi:Short-chain alcohol dehydrogenase of unknown specificity